MLKRSPLWLKGKRRHITSSVPPVAEASHRGSLPKQYNALGGASVGHRWWNIGQHSDAMRQEVASSAWMRDASPETTYYASLSGSGKQVHRKEEEGDEEDGAISFGTQEEAQSFIDALEHGESEETKVPVLELAKGFYEDLATTASEELDAESEISPPLKSDEERREEARHIQREFFADYYVAQECVPEALRQEFLDTMRSSPVSFVVPDSNRVLSRLVVRQQLERHTLDAPTPDDQFFFPVSWMDGAFSVGAGPWGGWSKPADRNAAETAESVSCTLSQQQIRSPLDHHNNEGGHTANAEDEVASVTAEDLFDAMTAVLMPPVSSPPSTSTTDSVERSLPTSSLKERTATPTRSQPVDCPPSLVHLYWMQRAIGSGCAIDMDATGLLVPLLLDVRPDDVVLTYVDVGEREGNGSAAGGYTDDVVCFMRRMQQPNGGVELDDGVRGGVVVLERPTAHDDAHNHQPTHEADQQLSHGEAIPADLRRSPSPDRVESEHVAVLRLSQRNTIARGPFTSILCAPRTTGDGLRPRVVLGSDASAEVMCPLHRSMTLIERAGRGFLALRNKLLYGLRTLRARANELASSPHAIGTQRPLRLVYAVNSMNPLECEAIVVSALRAAAQDRDAADQPIQLRPLPIHSALHMESPVDAADIFCGFEGGWGNGLAEWISVEGAPPESEPDAQSAEIRLAVAAASWRFRPATDCINGGYVCVVEAAPAVLPSLCGMSTPLESTRLNAVECGSSNVEEDDDALVVVHVPKFLTALKHSLLSHCPISGSVLLSRSVMQFLTDLQWSRRGHHAEVIALGMPISLSPSSTFSTESHTAASPPVVLNPLLSGTVAGTWLSRRWHRIEPMLAVPSRGPATVTVPVELLIALLYKRVLTREEVVRGLQVVQQRLDAESQLEVEGGNTGGTKVPSGGPGPRDALQLLLASLDASVSAASLNMVTPQMSLWITVRGWCALHGSAAVAPLHADVEAEMERLAMVADLEIVRSSSSASSHMDWVLHLPHRIHSSYSVDIEERVVGARDALQYIARMVMEYTNMQQQTPAAVPLSERVDRTQQHRAAAVWSASTVTSRDKLLRVFSLLPHGGETSERATSPKRSSRHRMRSTSQLLRQ